MLNLAYKFDQGKKRDKNEEEHAQKSQSFFRYNLGDGWPLGTGMD